MTLYAKIKDGKTLDLKWFYCEACKMEWMAPNIPDAYPQFCCHCKAGIDVTLLPHDVLDDVEEDAAPPRIYDRNLEGSAQTSHFQCAPDVAVRVTPNRQYSFVGDDEVDIITDRISFQINEWVYVDIEMSHYSLVEFSALLQNYIAKCSDLYADGRTTIGAPELRRFTNFKLIGEGYEIED